MYRTDARSINQSRRQSGLLFFPSQILNMDLDPLCKRLIRAAMHRGFWIYPGPSSWSREVYAICRGRWPQSYLLSPSFPLPHQPVRNLRKCDGLWQILLQVTLAHEGR